MKLLRYGALGAEKPGLLDNAGLLRDLSAHVDDITGATLDDATLARLRALDPADLPIVEGEQRIGACVGNIGKFLCIGLNYSDHAAETGAAIPEYPILFFKPIQPSLDPMTMSLCHSGLKRPIGKSNWVSSSVKKQNM